MAIRAIIVGCEDYSTAGVDNDLVGCVDDALDFYDWLVGAAGANGGDIELLLAASKTEPLNPRLVGLQYTPDAEADTVIDAITRLMAHQDPDDRLFFYFSGHGSLTQVRVGVDQSAICCQDLRLHASHKALTIDSIHNRFRVSPAQSQIFIYDCCRDPALSYGQTPGEVPKGHEKTAEGISQYAMLATLAGRKAHITNKKSFFTSELLEGLKGAEEAKIWSASEECYQVRWDRLLQRVERALRQPQYKRNNAYQIPTKLGESVGGELVLANFEWRKVKGVEVSVDIVGGAPVDVVVQSDQVVVNGQVDQETQTYGKMTQGTFIVPPLGYTVQALFPNRPKAKKIDAYSAQRVELAPDPPAAPPPPPPPPPPGPFPISPTSPSPDTLSVISGDANAHLQIIRGGDAIPRKEGEGRVDLSQAKPGPYRARLITAGGNIVEKSFHFDRGDGPIVLSDPARSSPALSNLAFESGLRREDDGTIAPTADLGEVGGVRATTLMAIGIAQRLAGEPGRLSALGGRAFWDAPKVGFQGVHLVILDDNTGSPLTGAYQMQLESQRDGSSVHVGEPVADSSPDQGWTGSVESDPGSVWLKVGSANEAAPPMRLAVTVLPSRVALVIMHRGQGQTRIHQYLPPFPGFDLPGDVGFSGRRTQSLAVTIERAEAFQRASAAGRSDLPPRSLEDLAFGKWREPLTACLAGYVLLRRMGFKALSETRRRDYDFLNTMTSNLTEYFGGLTDSLILRAKFHELDGDAHDEKQAWRWWSEAFESRAAPLCLEGLRMMASAGVDGLPGATWARELWQRSVSQRIWVMT